MADIADPAPQSSPTMPEEPPMEIRRPKPVHNWRELLGSEAPLINVMPFVLLALFLAPSPALAFDCTTLTGTTVSKSAIGLPTSGAVVSSASLVDDPYNGTYCKLLGGIKPVDPTAPDIKFQINLPQHWNGKAVQMAGGGYDGTVVTGESLLLSDPAIPLPLRQGYVTFGSDSGHEGAISVSAFPLNAEALANFQGAQIKKTHDTAIALIRRAFHARPQHMYFVGGSEGGREALLAAERWPAGYDGVISMYPVFDIMALETSFLEAGQVIFGKPGAWVPPAKLAQVSAKVLDACDGLDGLKDGLIGNVKACRATFDLASLRCTGGADTGTDCLSDAGSGHCRNGQCQGAVTTDVIDDQFGWESGGFPQSHRPNNPDSVLPLPAAHG